MAEAENSSSSPNSTQALDWTYYSWCMNYFTVPIIWSAILMVCFILGFPASVWVLHELIQRKRQRSTSDIFMLSLAIIDMTFTCQIPFTVCNFMIWHITELHNFFVLIYSLGIWGRPLFMASICWDCYVAVVYPIMYKNSTKLIICKKAIAITVCVVITTDGLAVCNMPWLIGTPLMALPLIVALPVMLFCNISIVQTLRKPDPTGKTNMHPQKKHALQTIFNSIILTFVVYLPPVIIFSFLNLIPLSETKRFCGLAYSGACYCVAGSVIMPILYLVTVGKLDTLKNWWKK